MTTIQVVGGIKTEPEEVLMQPVKEEDSNVVEINTQDIQDSEEETEEKLKNNSNNNPVKIKADDVKVEFSEDSDQSTDCEDSEDMSDTNECRESNTIEVLSAGQRNVYQKLAQKPSEMVLLNYSDTLRNRQRQHRKIQEYGNRLYSQPPVDKGTMQTLENNEESKKTGMKYTVLPDKQYQCYYCPFVNMNKKEMVGHIHHNHKNTTLAFPDIHVDEGTVQTLQNNEGFTKTGKNYTVLPNKQYQCNYCPFVNMNKRGMSAHIYQKHKNTTLDCLDIHVDKGNNEGLKKPGEEYTVLPDKQYRCNYCPFVNRNRRKMVIHIQHNHKDNVWASQDVVRLKRLTEISDWRYIAWVEYRPLGDDQYRCNHCQIVIHGIKQIEQHITDNHRQVKMNQCPHCPYQSRFNIAKHILSLHTSENEINYYSCHICERKFKLKSGLTRHMLNQHVQPGKQLRCPECPKMFKTLKYLTEHVRRIHKGGTVEKVKCFHCSYESISRDSLAHHIQSCHTNIESLKTFQCQLCPFKTKFRMLFHSHNSNYHRQTRVCHVCSYTCRTKLQLDLHLMTHKEKLEEKDLKYRCDQCDYKTYRLYNLTIHKLKHKKPEEIEYFYCYHCDFKAKRKDNLKSHIFRHEKKKEIKYDCYICEFKTIKKDVLIRHINKHSKEAKNDVVILKTEEVAPELNLKDEKKNIQMNRPYRSTRISKIKIKK